MFHIVIYSSIINLLWLNYNNQIKNKGVKPVPKLKRLKKKSSAPMILFIA